MGPQDDTTPYRDEEEEYGDAPRDAGQEQERVLQDTENGHATQDDAPAPEARWKKYTEPSANFLSSLRPTNIGFFPTIRAIFNYPAPDLDLRSTAWLDGLRGLAAFEVFIFHYCDGWMDNRLSWGSEKGDHTDPSWWLLPFIRTLYASGDASVCLFFAISGYVLSHRMLKLLRQQRTEDYYSSLSSAVFRRGIRLYLPVAVETFVLMILCRYLGLPKPVDYFPADTLLLEIKSWWVSLVHLFLPLRWPALWYDILNRYDGHISWTIPLEYFGSLVTYLVLLAVGRIQNMTARQSVFAAIIVHAFAKDDWISAEFLLGMVYADWQLRNEEREKEMEQGRAEPNRAWKRFRAVFFPLLFIFGFYLAGLPAGNFRREYEGDGRIYDRPFYDWIIAPFVYFDLYADRQADRYILCIAGMSSVIGVGETPFLRRFAMTRPVQYLGKISFGLYLCHIFMRSWLRPLNEVYVSLVGLTLEDLEENNRQTSLALMVAFALHILCAIPLNFIMGGFFERFLDTPSVNAAKRLEKYLLSPVKSDLLPKSASQRPPPTSSQGIQMVAMGSDHRAVRPTAVPHPASRSSLPPPTDFEDETREEPGHTGPEHEDSGQKPEGSALL